MSTPNETVGSPAVNTATKTVTNTATSAVAGAATEGPAGPGESVVWQDLVSAALVGTDRRAAPQAGRFHGPGRDPGRRAAELRRPAERLAPGRQRRLGLLRRTRRGPGPGRPGGRRQRGRPAPAAAGGDLGPAHRAGRLPRGGPPGVPGGRRQDRVPGPGRAAAAAVRLRPRIHLGAREPHDPGRTARHVAGPAEPAMVALHPLRRRAGPRGLGVGQAPRARRVHRLVPRQGPRGRAPPDRGGLEPARPGRRDPRRLRRDPARRPGPGRRALPGVSARRQVPPGAGRGGPPAVRAAGVRVRRAHGGPPGTLGRGSRSRTARRRCGCATSRRWTTRRRCATASARAGSRPRTSGAWPRCSPRTGSRT